MPCFVRLSFKQVDDAQEELGIQQYVKNKHTGAFMPLGKLLSLIDEMYQEKMKADEIDDRGARVPFSSGVSGFKVYYPDKGLGLLVPYLRQSSNA